MITVNGKPIGEELIAQEMQYHPAGDMADAAHRAATALVIRQALLDAAKARGLAAAPEEGETEDEALIRALMDADVTRPAADEAECRRYYERNTTKFCGSPIVEACHILLAAAPGDDEERDGQREAARALIATLQTEPGRFAELALAHSACPSKEQGGNLGQLVRGSTVPEFERQLFRLPEGLAGHPIESRYGFHVVYVERFIAGKVLPFEQVRQSIADYLGEKSHRAAIRHYIQEVLSTSEVSGIEMDVPDTPLTQ